MSTLQLRQRKVSRTPYKPTGRKRGRPPKNTVKIENILTNPHSQAFYLDKQTMNTISKNILAALLQHRQSLSAINATLSQMKQFAKKKAEAQGLKIQTQVPPPTLEQIKQVDDKQGQAIEKFVQNQEIMKHIQQEKQKPQEKDVSIVMNKDLGDRSKEIQQQAEQKNLSNEQIEKLEDKKFNQPRIQQQNNKGTQ